MVVVPKLEPRKIHMKYLIINIDITTNLNLPLVEYNKIPIRDLPKPGSSFLINHEKQNGYVGRHRGDNRILN